jgi:hypothetical protein
MTLVFVTSATHCVWAQYSGESGLPNTPLYLNTTELRKDPDFQTDWKKVIDLGCNNDYHGLEDFVGYVKKKYSSESTRMEKLALLNKLAFTISSGDFGLKMLDEQHKVAGNLAELILDEKDAPIYIAAQLLPLTKFKLEEEAKMLDPASEAWTKSRAAYARRWLITLQKLDQCIPQDFDPSKPINTYSGDMVAKDPVERKKLLDKRNQLEAESYKQSVLFQYYKVRKQFIPELVSHVGWAYSLPPKRLENLREHMTAYNIDPAVQEKILAEAKKKPDDSTIP